MSTRTSLSLAVVAALIAAGLSYGQQQETPGAQAPRDSAQQDDQQLGQAGQPGQERQAGYRGQTARAGQEQTLRLSEIMDMEVRNAQDEELGEIEDVVVEKQSGKIRYAAISVGGFLGIGDRLIAVPWQALRIQQQQDDPDEKFVLLNADRSRIENAPGFNEDNWPDFGNPRYSQEIETYYQSDSARQGTTGARSATEQRTNQFDTRDTQDRTGTGTRSGAGTDTGSDVESGTRSGAGTR